MIFLVTFGLSKHHGSELAVGWQWFERLKRHGDLRVLTHATFDSDRFIPSDVRAHCAFLGDKPDRDEDVTARPLKAAVSFWHETRSYLRLHATHGDKVVVVSPSTMWFLPITARLPVPRESIFYGPAGVTSIDLRLCETFGTFVSAVLRNAVIGTAAVAWRLLWWALPGNISLRNDAPWFTRIAGPRFRWCGILPEVEGVAETEGSPRVAKRQELPGRAPTEFLVLFDPRPRKNSAASLAAAVELARTTNGKLLVIGMPAKLAEDLLVRCRHDGIDLTFSGRLSRVDFQRHLRESRPTIVNLSLSEGVPSLIIEALAAGCTVVTYPVGGIQWPLAVSSVETVRTPSGRHAVALRWDEGAYNRYRERARDAFAALLCRILRT